METDDSVIDLRKIVKGRPAQTASPSPKPTLLGATHEENAATAQIHADSPAKILQEQNLGGQAQIYTDTADEQISVEWQAPESRRGRLGIWHYAGLIIAAGGLIALGVLAESYFFIAFIILALVVLALYRMQKPKEGACIISRDGIRIETALHPFSEFVSFWIFEYPRGTLLSLETKKLLARFLYLPLGDADAASVRNALKRFLPEKERELGIIDHLAERFGF